MGAVGAMLLALAKRLSRRQSQAAQSRRSCARPSQATAKLSAFVMFILIGARIFSLTFYGVNGHRWVEHLLVSLPGGEVGFLIFVNVLVFFLAFFLDFFELAFIIIPLLAPAAARARDRSDLVRRDPRRQHADELHASARSALRCSILRSVAPRSALRRQGDGAHHAGGDHAGRSTGARCRTWRSSCVMVALLIAFPGPRAPRQGYRTDREAPAVAGAGPRHSARHQRACAAALSAGHPRRAAAAVVGTRRSGARFFSAAGDRYASEIAARFLTWSCWLVGVGLSGRGYSPRSLAWRWQMSFQ